MEDQERQEKESKAPAEGQGGRVASQRLCCAVEIGRNGWL